MLLGLKPRKSFEVHTARIAIRSSPDGGVVPQLLIGILQRERKPGLELPGGAVGNPLWFEGGCTIIADLRRREVKYCIRKGIASDQRLLRQQRFALESAHTLRATYFGTDGRVAEPFAAIHRGL